MKNRNSNAHCAAIACLGLFLSGCAAHEAKDATKHLGASVFEQVFILAVFGADELQRHNEEKEREEYWRTTPYRSSLTRETYLETRKRVEFEELYKSLGAPFGPFSLSCTQLSGDTIPDYCGAPSHTEDIHDTTPPGENQGQELRRP